MISTLRQLLLACALSASAIAQGGNLGVFSNSGDVGGPAIKGSTVFSPASRPSWLTSAKASSSCGGR